uniref:DNA2/NAM7 helicase-like C-terminal domain-containing protein n=1 Tax=Mycena chlorophos TaxID=658473 RepID=A0ABQ0LEG1_MYCCL|nr:predicted protein [Mycena chlorophos]
MTQVRLYILANSERYPSEAAMERTGVLFYVRESKVPLFFELSLTADDARSLVHLRNEYLAQLSQSENAALEAEKQETHSKFSRDQWKALEEWFIILQRLRREAPASQSSLGCPQWLAEGRTIETLLLKNHVPKAVSDTSPRTVHFLRCQFARPTNDPRIPPSLTNAGRDISRRDRVVLSHRSFWRLALGVVREQNKNWIELDLSLPADTYERFVQIVQAESSSRDWRLDKDVFAGREPSPRSFLRRLAENPALASFVLDSSWPPPVFETDVLSGISLPGWLDEDQTRALRLVLSARDYALVRGMTGTGKTTVLAIAAGLLAGQGGHVLLVARTNAAVDDLAVRVTEYYPHAKLHRIATDDHLSAVHGTLRAAKYRDGLQANIVAVTCSSAYKAKDFTFSHVLIDGANGITIPEILPALSLAPVFILAADPRDLQPIVQLPANLRSKATTSLFRRLSCHHHPIALADLTRQHWLNPTMTMLLNKIAYIDCASESSTSMEGVESLASSAQRDALPEWLQCVVDENRSVVIVNTSTENEAYSKALERRSKPGYTNEGESNLVVRVIAALLDVGVASNNIVVVSLYRSQINLLSEKLSDIDVATVYSSQHVRVEYSVISLVRSSLEYVKPLRDLRQMSCALARASKKTIIICSEHNLRQIGELSCLFDNQGVSVVNVPVQALERSLLDEEKIKHREKRQRTAR